ncbi:hypothetical protein GCM10007385_39080 [Tateyamaria omphalii]|uniref:polymer-forming cytoskeletal protein n=1 Tax=Tateyamaria omphalii TaxID=299262 RepID=UPI0016764349|nr:polymer-forming cytoskeletal protein [Tateyamaria omphalii]GGX66065.1 hypothetical protein GCM10007385_39080 [Tateyamaria omphalii]
MRNRCAAILSMLAVFAAAPAVSEIEISEHGGDTFISGETITQTVETSGDVFVAGRSATVLGQASGDFHAAGFDVVIDVNIDEDVYAAGAYVTMKGTAGEDLTSAGFTVRTEASSRVNGNARLAAATIIVDGPIDGALSATGRDVLLNAAIAGDVRIAARTLRFGPEAIISGQLTYSTDTRTDVPERVAPAARVTFTPLQRGRLWNVREAVGDMPSFPTFASAFFGFVVSLLFFVVLGAIALGFAPKKVSCLRKTIGASPGRTLLQGVAGLAILVGAIPVVAMTIVGIPFIPIALLGLIAVWTLAYALGAYAVAMRVWIGFGGDADPPISTRLLVLTMAIVVVALLNFVPFVGWVANYTLVLLGVGAMTHAAFLALIPDIDPALDVDMRPVASDDK